MTRYDTILTNVCLKVYGTNNLRVVDLSIVPLHFASHPQSVVYAIAEKGECMRFVRQDKTRVDDLFSSSCGPHQDSVKSWS